MGLNDFILNCEKNNKKLEKDIEYYKNKSQRLQQEKQELKQDIKNLVNIINHNCLELETTKDQFESLKRWNK